MRPNRRFHHAAAHVTSSEETREAAADASASTPLACTPLACTPLTCGWRHGARCWLAILDHLKVQLGKQSAVPFSTSSSLPFFFFFLAFTALNRCTLSQNNKENQKAVTAAPGESPVSAPVGSGPILLRSLVNSLS